MTPVLDTLVVGSGHNALVSACYLAREGWSVHVLERDTVPGGAVSTVERFPGYAVDRGSSAHIMMRHSGIVEELDLAAHGLRYLDCDPWAFAPPPPRSDRPGIVFHRDLDRTCVSIEKACRQTGGRRLPPLRDRLGTAQRRRHEVVREPADRPAPAVVVLGSRREGRRQRTVATLPDHGRHSARRVLRRRTAQGRARLVRRTVRAADVRTRHRRRWSASPR